MKLTEARRRVLVELNDDFGCQSNYITRQTNMTMTSVQSALRWCKNAGFVKYVGYWRITPAGRAALKNSETAG